jgi:Arc/MetJ-type ribon-helix-helix transcriptional regulator
MNKQITVRLPNELVAFVDQLVESGVERSRAAVVTRALEREQRRAIAARDAELLSRTGPDPGLQRLAEQLPSMAAWLARVAELEPAAVSLSAADVIREAREERDDK